MSNRTMHFSYHCPEHCSCDGMSH